MSPSAKPLAVVTGGAGFIGSHMVDLLMARGYRVHVLDNLTGGREANLKDHAANPDLVLDTRDIRALSHSIGVRNLIAGIELRRSRRIAAR